MSIDCIRKVLSAARDKTDIDEEHIRSVQRELETALGVESTAQNNDGSGVNSESSSSGSGWHIHFVPHHHLFQTGNDPLRMFRELEEFGELSSEQGELIYELASR